MLSGSDIDDDDDDIDDTDLFLSSLAQFALSKVAVCLRQTLALLTAFLKRVSCAYSYALVRGW